MHTGRQIPKVAVPNIHIGGMFSQVARFWPSDYDFIY